MAYPDQAEKLIIFVDLSYAVLFDVIEDNERGEYIFFFKPTPHMEWKNNIPEDEYDPIHRVIKKAYPKELCYCGDHSNMFQRWILLCDFYGRTDYDLFGKINQELLAKVRMYKEERDVWKTQALLSPLRTKKAIKHPEEFKTSLMEEMKKQKTIMAADYLTEGQKEKERGGKDEG